MWVMERRTIRWTLFVGMFLTLPTLLFLVQAVMFLPAVFYVAGIVYMIPKAFASASAGEMLAFLLFFGVHLVIYCALFLAIASVLAMLLARIPSPVARHAAVALLCCAMLAVTFFPLYGGGGHGPIRWVTLPGLIEEVERDYGSGSTLAVYGGAVLTIVALAGFRRWRRRTGATHG